MKKEISMSISQFMEIERRNLSLKEMDNLGSNKISKLNISFLIALISIMHLILPVKAFAIDTTYIEAVNTGVEIVYVTSAAILELAYNIITSTASLL